MKYHSIDRGILRFRQCEIVLSIAAILLAKVPICAEEYEPDDELAQPVPVLTQTVQSDAAKTVRRYPARIRAVEQVDVVSRLSADIEEIGFDEGGTVRKGQLLYRLDDTRFVAAVSNQTAQIAETKAKLELATLSFDRKRKLAEKEMAPAPISMPRVPRSLSWRLTSKRRRRRLRSPRTTTAIRGSSRLLTAESASRQRRSSTT